METTTTAKVRKYKTDKKNLNRLRKKCRGSGDYIRTKKEKQN